MSTPGTFATFGPQRFYVRTPADMPDVAVRICVEADKSRITALENLNMYDGGFAWEDWRRRSFKHERDIELAMRPIRDLGMD